MKNPVFLQGTIHICWILKKSFLVYYFMIKLFKASLEKNVINN